MRWGTALENLRKLTLSELPSQTVPSFAKGLVGFGALGAMIWGSVVTLLKLRVITLNPAKLMASLNERASVGALRDQLDFRHRFAKEFGEVCRALRMPRRAGMVIMIDDLDRCRPENVLDVLEAVNFLVTAGPCFVILGIDQEKVTNCVAYGFKNAILKLPQRGDPVRAERRSTEARCPRARALRAELSGEAHQHHGPGARGNGRREHQAARRDRGRTRGDLTLAAADAKVAAKTRST